ncbi:MAG TPA: hypothetical protein VEV44_03355 [Pseudoneobacillus sp.]|nr:hypothetical protein [Pseudoneobacillus sp.]
MKKLVFFLLIGGFVASNFYADKEMEAKNSSKLQPPFEEVKKVPPSDQKLLGENSEMKYLFVLLQEGKIHNAILANRKHNSSTIEVATIPIQKMESLFTSKSATIEDFNQEQDFIERFTSQNGIPVNHIIVLDKQAYMDVFSKVFPKGISLNLTEEMKRNLAITNDSDPYLVSADEFIELIKLLNQNGFNKQEVYSMLYQSVTTQITKPDFIWSFLNIVNDLDQFVYTDLSINEMLSLGLSVMKESGTGLEKFDIPYDDQQVIETTPYEINNF